MKYDFFILVLAKKESELAVFWDGFCNYLAQSPSPSDEQTISSNHQFFSLPADKDTNAEALDIIWQKAIESINAHPEKLLLILTDHEDIQKKAVWKKVLRKYPLIIMRWWDAQEIISPSVSNRFYYNRKTGINLYLDRSRHLKPLDSTQLEIQNPVGLKPSALADNGDSNSISFQMLQNTFKALIEPERTDIFGNVKRDFSHIRLSVATHFYCNQNNMESVDRLLEQYASYSSDLLDRVQFVIVDDGSPIDYEIPKYNLNLTWLKIDQNILWNQPGARNLAMMYARSNNVLISDLDLSFPEHTLEWLSKRDIRNKRFYKLYRKSPSGTMQSGHPNLFYLSRSNFFERFGYDEEFSGAWGADDYRFVKNRKYHGINQLYLPKKYYCLERSINRQRSYHSLVRDVSFNTPIDTRKRMEAEYFGKHYGHSKSQFNFTWKVLADHQRSIKPGLPPINKWWRQAWQLRQIASLFCSR